MINSTTTSSQNKEQQSESSATSSISFLDKNRLDGSGHLYEIIKEAFPYFQKDIKFLKINMASNIAETLLEVMSQYQNSGNIHQAIGSVASDFIFEGTAALGLRSALAAWGVACSPALIGLCVDFFVRNIPDPNDPKTQQTDQFLKEAADEVLSATRFSSSMDELHCQLQLMQGYIALGKCKQEVANQMANFNQSITEGIKNFFRGGNETPPPALIEVPMHQSTPEVIDRLLQKQGVKITNPPETLTAFFKDWIEKQNVQIQQQSKLNAIHSPSELALRLGLMEEIAALNVKDKTQKLAIFTAGTEYLQRQLQSNLSSALKPAVASKNTVSSIVSLAKGPVPSKQEMEKIKDFAIAYCHSLQQGLEKMSLQELDEQQKKLKEVMQKIPVHDKETLTNIDKTKQMLSEQETYKTVILGCKTSQNVLNAAGDLAKVFGNKELSRFCTVSSKAIAIFENGTHAIEGFSKIVSGFDSLKKLSWGAFFDTITGNLINPILGVVSAVSSFFSLFCNQTDPTQEGLKQISRQVQALHQDMIKGFQHMDKRFDAIHYQLEAGFNLVLKGQQEMVKAMDEGFKTLDSRMGERFKQLGEYLEGHFNHLHKQLDAVREMIHETAKAQDEKLNWLATRMELYFSILQGEQKYTQTILKNLYEKSVEHATTQLFFLQEVERDRKREDYNTQKSQESKEIQKKQRRLEKAMTMIEVMKIALDDYLLSGLEPSWSDWSIWFNNEYQNSLDLFRSNIPFSYFMAQFQKLTSVVSAHRLIDLQTWVSSVKRLLNFTPTLSTDESLVLARFYQEGKRWLKQIEEWGSPPFLMLLLNKTYQITTELKSEFTLLWQKAISQGYQTQLSEHEVKLKSEYEQIQKDFLRLGKNWSLYIPSVELQKLSFPIFSAKEFEFFVDTRLSSLKDDNLEAERYGFLMLQPLALVLLSDKNRERLLPLPEILKKGVLWLALQPILWMERLGFGKLHFHFSEAKPTATTTVFTLIVSVQTLRKTYRIINIPSREFPDEALKDFGTFWLLLEEDWQKEATAAASNPLFATVQIELEQHCEQFEDSFAKTFRSAFYSKYTQLLGFMFALEAFCSLVFTEYYLHEVHGLAIEFSRLKLGVSHWYETWCGPKSVGMLSAKQGWQQLKNVTNHFSHLLNQLHLQAQKGSLQPECTILSLALHQLHDWLLQHQQFRLFTHAEDDFTLRDLGDWALRKGDFKSAKSFYLEAFKNNPKQKLNAQRVAVLYEWQDRSLEAQPYWLVALEKEPHNTLLLRCYADSLARTEDYDLAILYYTRVLAIEPFQKYVLNARGKARFLKILQSRQMFLLEGALSKKTAKDILLDVTWAGSTMDMATIFTAAESWLQLSEKETSLSLVMSMLEHSPSDPLLRLSVVQWLRHQGFPDKASEILQQIAAPEKQLTSEKQRHSLYGLLYQFCYNLEQGFNYGNFSSLYFQTLPEKKERFLQQAQLAFSELKKKETAPVVKHFPFAVWQKELGTLEEEMGAFYEKPMWMFSGQLKTLTIPAFPKIALRYRFFSSSTASTTAKKTLPNVPWDTLLFTADQLKVALQNRIPVLQQQNIRILTPFSDENEMESQLQGLARELSQALEAESSSFFWLLCWVEQHWSIVGIQPPSESASFGIWHYIDPRGTAKELPQVLDVLRQHLTPGYDTQIQVTQSLPQVERYNATWCIAYAEFHMNYQQFPSENAKFAIETEFGKIRDQSHETMTNEYAFLRM